MSLSDLVLTILVLAVTALVLWVYDINPYSNKLHVYTQQCDNMILDNTYCKGTWHDRAVEAYIVDQQTHQIAHVIASQSDFHTFENCSIEDRKNWTCNDTRTSKVLTIRDGKIQLEETSDLQQISRLQWLQNKVLNFIS